MHAVADEARLAVRDERPLTASRDAPLGGQAVLEGVPDHRDSVLTPAERETNEVMMICVSRCCTPRLVLDL